MENNSFESVLSGKDLAVTEPRRIIFSILKNASRPLSPKEVLKEVTFTDRATVYRTLATFESAGIINSVVIEGETLFEPSDLFLDHHHHMYCSSCDAIERFSSKDIEKAIVKSSKKARFSLEQHSLVLTGLCSDCSGN